MLKILIAEDDLMIADMTEDVLTSAGYEVCGIVRTVAAAVALIRLHKPDLALIDLRLADGGLGTEIAAELGALHPIGILYATGNSTQFMLTAADGIASLAKPFRTNDLLRSLDIVKGILAQHTPLLPFPRGFQMLPLKSTLSPENAHG